MFPNNNNAIVAVANLTSIRQFQDLMTKARGFRRLLVKSILDRKPCKETTLVSLANIERMLEEKLRSTSDGVTMHLNGVELNVRDEIEMFQKDGRFLSAYYKTRDHHHLTQDDNEEEGKDKLVEEDGVISDEFIDYLSESHPRGKEAFLEETNQLLNMFNSDSLLSSSDEGKIDVFITDWDGTMKTYASNYQTSIQPAYSGVILSVFVKKFTKLAAVLTAGPLRNFGILDSTSIPWEEGYLKFGGSWGREWMIDGRIVAEEKILTPQGADALAKLGERIERLLNDKEEFNKFLVVGSGYQKKMDRITIGIQNINGHVDKRASQRYIDAVLAEVLAVDPDGELFEVVRLELELEVALKGKNEQQAADGQGEAQAEGAAEPPVNSWTKADGIRFLMEQVGVDPAACSVLICGDTVSDVPMVETVLRLNPSGTYAVFVNPNAEVKKRLIDLLPDNQRCFVGCPEVLHAAMAKRVIAAAASSKRHQDGQRQQQKQGEKENL